MRIGVYTHYAHCDQAYLCLRLLELFRQCGLEFDIYADNQPAKMGTPYDKLVLTKSIIKFTDWVKKHDAVIWTHPPKIEQIKCADRANVKTVIAPMWQELKSPFKKVLQAADVVVTLCSEQTELFRDVYNLRGTVLIPFDTGLPFTRKSSSVNPKCVRVLLPWFDRNARCTGVNFLADLGFLVERMHELHLTVAITSSRFAPSIASFFKKLGERAGDRVNVVRSVALKNRPALFSQHDLTILPAECDNYGYAALTSINMGTPVLTTHVSPQKDIIENGQNGLLVRTKTDYDENGVAHALPDYELFISALQEMIAEPWHIDAISRQVTKGLITRRRAFEAGWKQVLSIA